MRARCNVPYKILHGRRVQLPRGVTNGVQYVVSLEGSVATFECKRAGHRMTKDFNKGFPRIGTAMLAKMAAYWGLGGNSNSVRGHCYGWCQKCQNEADKVRER